jgi:thiol-disulfide isomerase/thioredoxin
MCIDKKTSLPVLRQSKVFFQGNCQYSSIYIKNLTLNTVSKSRFSATQLTGYTKKDYVSFPQSEKHPLLDSNSLAPIVTGKNYSKTLQPDIINYSGKITVLDFWYMECFPCVKAIPEIEKLHEKYKGKNVQFYGVNHIDNKEFNISKIPQFLQYNKMEYPTILIDADVTKSFKIIAWPTFYIIDEKGRIAYGTLGYEENMSDKMSPIIDKLLQSN